MTIKRYLDAVLNNNFLKSYFFFVVITICPSSASCNIRHFTLFKFLRLEFYVYIFKVISYITNENWGRHFFFKNFVVIATWNETHWRRTSSTLARLCLYSPQSHIIILIEDIPYNIVCRKVTFNSLLVRVDSYL